MGGTSKKPATIQACGPPKQEGEAAIPDQFSTVGACVESQACCPFPLRRSLRPADAVVSAPSLSVVQSDWFWAHGAGRRARQRLRDGRFFEGPTAEK